MNDRNDDEYDRPRRRRRDDDDFDDRPRRRRRDEDDFDRPAASGKGLGSGAIIAIVVAVVGGLTAVIYFAAIKPASDKVKMAVDEVRAVAEGPGGIGCGPPPTG